MLLRMLESTAARHGARPALRWPDGELSWRELADAVCARARALAADGVAEGRALAMLLPNGPDFVIDFFATAACRAVAIPLSPELKLREVATCVEGAGLTAIACHASTEDVAREAAKLSEARVLLRGDDVARDDTGGPAGEAFAGDVLYGFSSGSTGTPKRIVRTQANLASEAEHFTAAAGLGPDDVILGVVPLHHAHGLGNCVLAAVRSGACLVLEPRFEPRRTLSALSREGVTLFPGAPFLFRLLAEVRSDPLPDLGRLRLAFSAGAALPPSVFEAFDKRFGIPVRQLYGCSEAGSVTLNLDPDAADTAGTSGLPLGEALVAILSEDGVPCATGEVGEVVIASPALGRSRDGSESFRDGRFHTGDLGALDAAGRLTLHGRTKVFVSTAAGKVDPVEVERCLAEHPQVAEVVVVGVAGRGGDELVKAVVVPRDPAAVPDEAALRRELVRLAREQLAEFKVPRRVELRGEIPRSPLGKVLRKYLV